MSSLLRDLDSSDAEAVHAFEDRTSSIPSQIGQLNELQMLQPTSRDTLFGLNDAELTQTQQGFHCFAFCGYEIRNDQQVPFFWIKPLEQGLFRVS